MKPLWQRIKQPTNGRLWGGNQVQLLSSGKDYFQALETAFDAAQHEIFVETYLFHPDPSGERLAQALIRAAQRGVAVKVLVDGFGSSAWLGHWRQRFQNTPVQWRAYQALTQWWHWFMRHKLRRLHRKLVVIDSRIAFVGGINFIDDWVDPQHGKLDHPRFDFAVRIAGPLALVVERAMRSFWRPRTWLPLAVPGAPLPKAAQRQAVRAQLVLRNNVRQRRSIEKTYLRAIARAKHSVLLANAYFFPGVKFRRALKLAAGRGVKVTLLLQGRQEYFLQHYATQALYDELLNAGIYIAEYTPSFLHAKVAVIDDHWATVGSSNIDPFSLLLSHEANVVIDDAGFNQQLRQILEQAVQNSRRVTPTHHAQRGRLVRVLNALAFGVLRLAVGLSGASARY